MVIALLLENTVKRNIKIKTPRRDNELALVLEQLVRNKRIEMSSPKEFSDSVFMKDIKHAVFLALGDNARTRSMLGYLILLE